MKRFALAAACLLVLASRAAPAAPPDAHSQTAPPKAAEAAAATRGVGVVRKVDAAAGKVTLEHEAIESLGWPPMTMAFRVRDARLLEGLAPGRKVRFAFVQQGSAYVITGME